LILAEITALRVVGQAEALVPGDWAVILAAADAQADGETLPHADFRAEPGPDTEASAILIHVALWREDGAANVERCARVNRVKDGKGAGVVIAARVENAFVADANVAGDAEARHPIGTALGVAQFSARAFASISSLISSRICALTDSGI